MSFSTKTAPTQVRSRFNLDHGRSAALLRDGERVSIGVDPKDGSEHLVWSFGAQSSAVPIYAAAVAIAGGKVVPTDDLVAAIAEAGGLGKLKSAIEKHEKAATKAGA